MWRVRSEVLGVRGIKHARSGLVVTERIAQLQKAGTDGRQCMSYTALRLDEKERRAYRRRRYERGMCVQDG
jgi:hypothetical protein